MPPASPAIAAVRRDLTTRVDPLVFALFFPFGLGAWIAINGIFAELPIYAVRSPEGWAIASQLSLAVQCSNVFPALWLLARRRGWAPRSEVGAVHATLGVGTVGLALFAAGWDVTARVAGSERSVGLLLGTFLCGAVDAMTSVLFWPFVARFPAPYTAALAGGEGSSALVAGALSLVQKPDHDDPVFGVSAFLLACMGMTITAWLAFAALLWSHRARAARTDTGGGAAAAIVGENGAVPLLSSGPPAKILAPGSTAIVAQNGDSDGGNECGGVDCVGCAARAPQSCHRRVSTLEYARAHAVPLAVISLCALANNGVLPAVSTYALLPYARGRVALLWTGIATSIAEPLAGTAAKFTIALSATRAASIRRRFPRGDDDDGIIDTDHPRRDETPEQACPLTEPRSLVLQVLSWAPMTVAILVFSAMSPDPPLGSATAGAAVLPAFFFVAHKILTVHTRTCALVGLRSRGGARAAQMGGVAVQVGSVIGAITMFLLVQYTDTFSQ